MYGRQQTTTVFGVLLSFIITHKIVVLFRSFEDKVMMEEYKDSTRVAAALTTTITTPMVLEKDICIEKIKVVKSTNEERRSATMALLQMRK